MITLRGSFHADSVFFDKRKKRVGVVVHVGELKQSLTIKWSDNSSDVILAHAFEKACKRYKVLRIRDFPITILCNDGVAFPARLRKDEYKLDGDIIQYTRLLDIIALKEATSEYVRQNLLNFLPRSQEYIYLDSNVKKSLREHFLDPIESDYSVESTLDRVNQSLYRVRISTLIKVKYQS